MVEFIESLMNGTYSPGGSYTFPANMFDNEFYDDSLIAEESESFNDMMSSI